MKKKMFILMSGCMVFIASVTKLQAQETSFAVNQKTSNSNFSTTRETNTPLKPENVNATALNNFSKHFKDASSTTWIAEGDLLSVYFTDHNIKKRSTYNAKGNLEYTISYYNESTMPEGVRDIVKHDYQFMPITSVTEVLRSNRLIYFVKLENKESIYTVSVVDGETSLVQQINKHK